MNTSNEKIVTRFNDIIIIKQVYNFLNLKYDGVDIISVELKDQALNIYFEGGLFHYYKDIISVQNEIKKYLIDNLSCEVQSINIIKL